MNVRRHRMPLGVVALVFLLVLATIGVVYGLWSKSLLINGTVNTGHVNAEFSINEIDEGDPSTSTLKPVFWEGDSDCDADTAMDDDCEIEGKDIGECTAVLKDGLPNPGSQLIEVTVTNGYPSYHCWVQFDVHNNGSIPIKLHQPVITNPNPDKVTVEVLPAGNHGPGTDNDSVCYHDGTIHPFPGDTTHPQLEPSEWAYCVLHMHVEQPAAENAGVAGGPPPYTFTAEILAHQWNEEP